MKSSNGLSKGRRDVNGVELGALGLEMVMGDSVCADDLEKLRVVDSLDSGSRQDTVSDDGNNISSTVLLEGLGGLGKSSAGVGHIVDQNTGHSLNISNQNHSRDLVSSLSLLVDQGKLRIQPVSESGGSVEKKISVSPKPIE